MMETLRAASVLAELSRTKEWSFSECSYEGSKMLLPDASFTKNLYQSSFQE
jgi:hypothetical protein